MPTLVNGAFSSTMVTKTSTANFPWINMTDKPLNIELEPGDEYVLDEGKQFFQLRMLSRGNRVRTWTPLLYGMADDRTGGAWEVELRTSDNISRGPSIQIDGNWSAIETKRHRINPGKLFEKFCDVIGSPLFNPFGFMPKTGTYEVYRFDFENRKVSWHDGSPLAPADSFPIKMEVFVDGRLYGFHKGKEPRKDIKSGVYNVKPANIDPHTGEVKSVMLDGFPDDKMTVGLKGFNAAVDDGRIKITSMEEAHGMDLSRYRV